VQFIADTQIAVNRAVVETWKLLHDITDDETGAAPLSLSGFYGGFQRDDRRSWIDFHDGISNLKSRDRHGVISIKPSPLPEERWTEGGTYLTFVRVAVDLVVWRKLTKQQQEILVGRDKLTGCPLISAGSGSVVHGCPAAGTSEITEIENRPFIEPPNVADPVIAMSHIQRANHHIDPANDPASLRVFRQGFEFLEPLDKYPGFRAGLNFISFQDTPLRLFRMLRTEGWLGRINFGGDPANQPTGMENFLTVRAAAIFLAPPVVDGEEFPGSSIWR
jgi:deferrochelatase/peroxidase EfeB